MQDTERPKFLTELLAEVDAFDAELFKPTHPVSSETEDEVKGVLSPWLRQLFALGRYYTRQMKMIAVERDYDEIERVMQDAQLCEMTYKHKLMDALLWPAIRAEHNLWVAERIGVRIGWQVVVSKPELTDDERIRQFLDKLTGRKK